MPEQKLIIYKITCEGKLESIESSKLLESFTSIDALAIYIYSMKRLYVWKGEHLDIIVGKYVPEAKDLILKADRNIRILRHIVIESGAEPQDFFDDIDLQPNILKTQLEKTEKIYEGLTGEIETLKLQQRDLFTKNNYDQALVKAQELLKLGCKLNKLNVIKDQQSFIKMVEEAKGLNEKIDKDFAEVSGFIEKSAFEQAWSKLDKIADIATTKKLPHVQDRVDNLRKAIEPDFKNYRQNIELFDRLVSAIEVNQKRKQWDAAFANCEKILTIAPKVGKNEVIPKYQALVAEVRGKSEQALMGRKKEQENFIQQANALRDVIPPEKNVLPIVEEFSIQELLGTLTQDLEEMMNRAGALLDSHRVQIKTTAESRTTLRSADGETVILEKTSKIETAKPPVISGESKQSPPPVYALQTGFENPLNDFIEEAVIRDLIPYNFEISEIYLDGEKPAKEPIRDLTRDGLEVAWTLQNIPPKEKVSVKYDLRRRVSRTLILTFEEALKIIKTHASLSQTGVEGVYDALLNFTNSFPTPLRFAVFEDILPLYYLFEIKQPNTKPALTSDSNAGTLVKWNEGSIPKNNDRVHRYRLLELFRFEIAKVKTYSKLEPALKVYQAGNYAGALATWSLSLANLKENLGVPATPPPNVENLTELDDVKKAIDNCGAKIRLASNSTELVDECEMLAVLFKRSADILEKKKQDQITEEEHRKEIALEAKKKAKEETARKKADEVEPKRIAAEEDAKKKAEEEAARMKAEEEEAKRVAAEEEAKKKAAEEERRLAEEEEARKKATAEEAIARKLQYAEENFQVAFGDRKYSDCLQSIPDIIQLASQLNKPEIVEKYNTIQKQIEENLQREAKIQAEQKEKSEKINLLKKSAAELESTMNFPEAKARYYDVKTLATEINDPLTVSFCDQRIAQIDAWAKEISTTDVGKWDIPPFRIINRLRYNVVDVVKDKDASQKRLNELAAQFGQNADLKSVTVVRSKFKGQGPFDEKGVCYTLYIRKVEK